jgi:hypothetical protein
MMDEYIQLVLKSVDEESQIHDGAMLSVMA